MVEETSINAAHHSKTRPSMIYSQKQHFAEDNSLLCIYAITSQMSNEKLVVYVPL